MEGYKTTARGEFCLNVSFSLLAPCVVSRSTGNFSDRSKFSAQEGALDGYFSQYLVRNRGWSYSSLAMDGLRSTVFDGLSPTYCVATRRVWFDHACSEKAGCLSPDTVQRIYGRDTASGVERYDWHSFYAGYNYCLRYSERGFNAQYCDARS
jgi:hypothetical protein